MKKREEVISVGELLKKIIKNIEKEILNDFGGEEGAMEYFRDLFLGLKLGTVTEVTEDITPFLGESWKEVVEYLGWKDEEEFYSDERGNIWIIHQDFDSCRIVKK